MVSAHATQHQNTQHQTRTHTLARSNRFYVFLKYQNIRKWSAHTRHTAKTHTTKHTHPLGANRRAGERSIQQTNKKRLCAQLFWYEFYDMRDSKNGSAHTSSGMRTHGVEAVQSKTGAGCAPYRRLAFTRYCQYQYCMEYGI